MTEPFSVVHELRRECSNGVAVSWSLTFTVYDVTTLVPVFGRAKLELLGQKDTSMLEIMHVFRHSVEASIT